MIPYKIIDIDNKEAFGYCKAKDLVEEMTKAFELIQKE